MEVNNKSFEEIISSYDGKGRDALIPILQDVQELEGYLSFDAMLKVSQKLKLPLSKVYGVASFYNQFKFKEPGKFHIQVCRGTACHVKGSLNILETLKRVLNIEVGFTTKDKLFSLEVVACVGACSLAPVICINGEYHAKLTSEKIEKIINKLREENK